MTRGGRLDARPRAGRAAAFLALLALTAALAACAGSPRIVSPSPIAPAATPPKAPAASAPSPAPAVAPEPVAAGPETSLKTAAPAALSKAHDERDAIDAAIVLGSPAALASSRSLIGSAAAIKAEETQILATISRGIESIVYPAFREDGSVAPPTVGEAPAGATSPLVAVLRILADASRGRATAVPPEIAGTPLAELAPALALINAGSSDATRLALDALDRFTRLGAVSVLPDYLLGLDAERRADWATAAVRYAAVLARASDAWPARIGLCKALLATGKAAEALEAARPIAAARTGDKGFDRPYAISLYQNGRYEECAPYVLRILIRDPQDAEFVLMRAHLLVRGRSFQQALPLLDAYATVDPGRRLFLLLRCLAAEGLKNRDEALRWARRGLSAYPDDPELLVAAARLIFAGSAAGREEARVLARKAFDLTAAPEAGKSGPDATPARAAARIAAGIEAARLLALDASTRYRWDEAQGYLDRALELGLFEDKELAATILRKAGKREESLDYASTWYRQAPSSDAAAEAYLRALVDIGNIATAQEVIARFLPGAATPAFRSTLYYLQSRMQASDDAALVLLRSALVEDADNPEALAAVYDIQFKRKDYPKARFYLKQALALAPGDPDLERRQRELDQAAP